MQSATPTKNSEKQNMTKKQVLNIKKKMTGNTSTNKNQNLNDISFNKYLSTFMAHQDETKSKEMDFENLTLAHSIIQNIQTGLVMITSDFKIKFCNSEMKKFFQIQDKQTILENLMEIKLKGQEDNHSDNQFRSKNNLNQNSLQEIDQKSAKTYKHSQQAHHKKKNIHVSQFSTNNQARKYSIETNQKSNFQKSHLNILLQNLEGDQVKGTPSDLHNNLKQVDISLSPYQDQNLSKNSHHIENFIQLNQNGENNNFAGNSKQYIQDDISISICNLTQMGLKQGKFTEIQHTFQSHDLQTRGDNTCNEKSNNFNQIENNFKKCIIPQRVLQIFELEDVYLYDLMKVIFEQQDRAYYNNCYSQNDLQENFNRFDSSEIKNKTENLLKAHKVIDQKQEGDRENNRYISHYIDKNNLIINLKYSSQHEVKHIQFRISFYIRKHQFDWNAQSFVIIEVFELDQLTLNLQEKEIADYKNRMLASVSHELRTPLNCSIQMLNILFDKFNQQNQIYNNQEIDEINQNIVKPALISNNLLMNIINDILDYAQINAGYFKLDFQSFSLLEIVTECAELMHFQATQKGLALDLHFDSNLPEKINSDQNRIKQVLLNLLSNSLKFTDKGYIEIRVISINSNLIKVDVKDTGCGIPQDNINKIFESFGNKSHQKFLNTQGAGLGLSVANNLAMGLGGNRKIEVKSKLSEGTSFSFFIVNRDSHKQGCEIKLKDVFNRRLIKWESINENIPLKSTSYLNQKSVQQQNTWFKNSITNSQKMLSKTDNLLEQSFSLNNNTNNNNNIKSSLNHFNSELFQDFISFSLKPNHIGINSSESGNFKVLPSFLGISQGFSNLNNEFHSPCSKPSNLNQAFHFHSKTIESLVQQTPPPLITNQQSQQQQQQSTQQIQQQNNSLAQFQKQKSLFSTNNRQKSKSIKAMQKSISITIEQQDSAENQITQDKVYQLQSPIKINKKDQIIQESCQIIEDQQINKNQIHDQVIFQASKIQDLDEIEIVLTEEYQNQFNQNLNPQTVKEYVIQESQQNLNQNDSSTQLEKLKISLNVVQDGILIRDEQQQSEEKNKQQKQDNQQKASNQQNKIFTTIKNIQWKCQCPKILIVDDNDFNLYAVSMRLQLYSISIDKALSGQIAIDKCKQMFIKNNCCKKYIAILMDIDMPIKDGHQTTQEIIQFYKSYNIQVPFISACSAFVQESEKKKALQSGMEFYITKPIQTLQFEQFLEKAFQEYF